MEKQQQELLIQQLNSVTPEQLLSELSGGATVPKEDLHIVTDMRDNYKLPNPVINVLIYYVMLRSDMRLNREYVERIAGHWVRKKVTTVEDALSLAKKENELYKEWINSKKKEENEPHTITVIDAIKGAIKAGLTDEQLGKYVRNLLVK
ncbi:DnaD domain protein [Bacillus paramycoides]|uniref:DnaD domain protein n=1 Tax=Bacillus paramycoides TaxID=2026194 RepID=UPI0015C0ED54|nr:DnaD domain protein [Bacillus paramycoides]